MTSTPVAWRAAEVSADVWTFGAPRFSFTTGSGGVGKTYDRGSLRRTSRGRRCEGAAGECRSGIEPDRRAPHPVWTPRPRAVEAVPGLEVLDLDPQTAAAEHRERALATHRDALPDAELTAFTTEPPRRAPGPARHLARVRDELATRAWLPPRRPTVEQEAHHD